MTMLAYAPDAPTQQLDLRADACATAYSEFVTIAKRLFYLKTLAETTAEYGYPMPYSSEQVDTVIVSVLAMAGTVERER